MRKVVRLTERDLNRLAKRVVNESPYDAKSNAAEMYELTKKKMERGLWEIEDFIKNGDVETSLHVTMGLRKLLNDMDSFVSEMK
jgi:hypothetical protein